MPGDYFVATTPEEFIQGIQSGEVFEAPDALAEELGLCPELPEHVISEEEFYAPRKPAPDED